MARTEALRIMPGVVIPADEIGIEFTRSGGPGGQNVNKVETCVVLRFRPGHSLALDERQRQRVLQHCAARLTTAGEILIRSSEHSGRERNLEAGRARLAAVLADALKPRRARRKTKPTRGSERRRLDSKRQQSAKKSARREVHEG